MWHDIMINGEEDPSKGDRSTGRRCCDVHLNSLWSIWYGLLTLGFQSFLVYRAVSFFLIYIALPWPEEQQPYLELNVFVALVGAGVVLLPFYTISFLFRIGNLANDGYKLGQKTSHCSMDPPTLLARSTGLGTCGTTVGPPLRSSTLCRPSAFFCPRSSLMGGFSWLDFFQKASERVA